MTAAAVGGSIQEVSIDGRIYAVAADADATRNLGGFTNEVQPNGDGSGRMIKTRASWVLSGLTLSINDDAGDQAALQAVADLTEFVVVTVTLASGTTYRGKGTITEAIEFSTQNSTAGVTLSGPDKLERQ